MDLEVVDPAWELAQCFEILLQQNPTTDATWGVMRNAVGSVLTDSEYWDIVSVCSSRMTSLIQLISDVKDRDFDERQRARTLEAARRAARVFSPAAQMQQWQQTMREYVIADDALHIGWFSHIARRHQPLRRLRDEDRAELISKIDSALESVEGRGDIPEWAKGPLTDGLGRLRLVLSHIIFFGCDTAILELFNLYTKTTAVDDEMAATQGSSGQAGENSHTIREILTVVALAAALFTGPDQVTTAIERYKGWYLKIIRNDPALPKPAPLLITGPRDASADEPTERDVSL